MSVGSSEKSSKKKKYLNSALTFGGVALASACAGQMLAASHPSLNILQRGGRSIFGKNYSRGSNILTSAVGLLAMAGLISYKPLSKGLQNIMNGSLQSPAPIPIPKKNILSSIGNNLNNIFKNRKTHLALGGLGTGIVGTGLWCAATATNPIASALSLLPAITGSAAFGTLTTGASNIASASMAKTIGLGTLAKATALRTFAKATSLGASLPNVSSHLSKIADGFKEKLGLSTLLLPKVASEIATQGAGETVAKTTEVIAPTSKYLTRLAAQGLDSGLKIM